MNHPLLERFALLSLRERIFILAAILAALWMGLDHYFLQPVWQQQSEVQQKIRNVEVQLNSLHIALADIEASGTADPNQKNRQALTALKAGLKQLEQQIQIGNKRFVKAESMGLVLAELLSKKHHLQLIRVEKLPVKALNVDAQQEKSWVFQHGLKLTFSGNYKNTYAYLQALETSPWRFLWQSIHYRTQPYPVAEVTITVYTLGFQRDWLRV